MKIKFTVKYGENVIDIPSALEVPKGSGLSNLYDKTFTIINQIPTSQTIATKIAWVKHTVEHCDKSDGIFDKSTGNMVYKANTFTVYLRDWQNYREPNFSESGYYSLYSTEKELYTAAVGDLVIFRGIDDPAPTTIKEFNDLRTKYANEGGILTGVEAFINYHSDLSPWRTNHIELIRG